MSVLNHGVLVTDSVIVYDYDTARELLNMVGLVDKWDVIRLVRLLACDDEIAEVLMDELGYSDQLADAEGDNERLSDVVAKCEDIFWNTSKLVWKWADCHYSSVPAADIGALQDVLRNAKKQMQKVW